MHPEPRNLDQSGGILCGGPPEKRANKKALSTPSYTCGWCVTVTVNIPSILIFNFYTYIHIYIYSIFLCVASNSMVVCSDAHLYGWVESS